LYEYPRLALHAISGALVESNDSTAGTAEALEPAPFVASLDNV
jgi:hypothetical protein